MENLLQRNLSVRQKTNHVTIKQFISGFETDLPDNPVRYTAVNAINNEEEFGVPPGINAYNVAVSAAETISTNPQCIREPLLVETGIGEEDIFSIALY